MNSTEEAQRLAKRHASLPTAKFVAELAIRLETRAWELRLRDEPWRKRSTTDRLEQHLQAIDLHLKSEETPDTEVTIELLKDVRGSIQPILVELKEGLDGDRNDAELEKLFRTKADMLETQAVALNERANLIDSDESADSREESGVPELDQ
jgi:hypothetical protein